MNPSEPGIQSPPTLSPLQRDQLLACARKLLQASVSGDPWRPLRGRNLGLLCEQGVSEGAELFRAACSELGARVATIQPSLDWCKAPQEVVTQTAQVLGRLYDAIECQGLAPELVAQLGAAAGVPVFDRIALPGTLSEELAGRIDPALPADTSRRYLLEAAILGALGLGG